MRKIKFAEVEYIESGAFQGGEENVSMAGIAYGEDCIVIKKKDWEYIGEQLFRLSKLEK